MSQPADIAPVTELRPAGQGPGPGPGPGARLRSAREQRGLALGAVAESLHVAPRLVAAMEANDFAAFDAPVYAKGFLRKYAAVLGVSVDEVLAAYEAVAAGAAAPTLIPAMTVSAPPTALSSLPRTPAFAVAALVLVAGGYWLWSARPHPAPAATPPAAEATAASERAAAPAAGAGTAAEPPGGAAEPAAGTAAAPLRPRPAEAGPVRAAAAATPAPQARAARSAAARDEALVISAAGECWTEVYSPSGTRLLYDLIRTGESRSVPGPGPWKVVLGAADAAQLTVGERAVAVPPPRRGATTAIFVVARDGAVR